MPPMQLIVFDLGGVMVRVCPDWRDALSRLNITPPPALLRGDTIERLTAIGHDYETGRIDTDVFCRRVMDVTDLDQPTVMKILDHWLIEPFDHWGDLLDRLAAAPVHTACLSNTNARHWQLMQSPSHAALPLDRLNFRLASHLIGIMKPDPGIYQHLEKITGADPEIIVFFDDNAANIAAAQAVGWHAKQITTDQPVREITQTLTDLGVFTPS